MKNYLFAPLAIHQLTNEQRLARKKALQKAKSAEDRRAYAKKKKRIQTLTRKPVLGSRLDVPLIVLMLKFGSRVNTLIAFVRLTQEAGVKEELVKSKVLSLSDAKSFSRNYMILRLGKLLGTKIPRDIKLPNGKVIKKGTVLPDFRTSGYKPAWSPAAVKHSREARQKNATN